MKIIRVIEYEGTKEALEVMLANSKSEGLHEYPGYTMRIATQLNQLPQKLTRTQIDNALSKENQKVTPVRPTALSKCAYCGYYGDHHPICPRIKYKPC